MLALLNADQIGLFANVAVGQLALCLCRHRAEVVKTAKNVTATCSVVNCFGHIRI